MEYLIIRHFSSPVGARMNKALGNGPAFRKHPMDMDFSYMDIRIYFHLLCKTCRPTHLV